MPVVYVQTEAAFYLFHYFFSKWKLIPFICYRVETETATFPLWCIALKTVRRDYTHGWVQSVCLFSHFRDNKWQCFITLWVINVCEVKFNLLTVDFLNYIYMSLEYILILSSCAFPFRTSPLEITSVGHIKQNNRDKDLDLKHALKYIVILSYNYIHLKRTWKWDILILTSVIMAKVSYFNCTFLWQTLWKCSSNLKPWVWVWDKTTNIKFPMTLISASWQMIVWFNMLITISEELYFFYEWSHIGIQ